MTLYQHYKGGLYIVISDDTADATNGHEQSDTRVVYCSCIDDGIYTRESSEFHGNVEHEGKVGPRFRVIVDAADIMPEGGHP